MTELPDFDDLPVTGQGERSGWGVFGPDDDLGLVNLLTPGRIAAAARLVERGAVFALGAPTDMFSPPLFPRRGVARHTILHRAGTASFDDILDNYYPQSSSQWDSLAHAGYGPDRFYNGAGADDVLNGRLTIDHWARRGIAGRAVLFDMERAREQAGRPYHPATSTAFGVDDLELARRHAGVELRTGDILLLHTGVVEWYRQQSEEVRLTLPHNLRFCGLAHGEDVCRYLWDHHVAAVATDTLGVEVWPPDLAPGRPYGMLHRILIGQFGMALGELWWLKDLAEDCAADGRHEMFLTSSPMNVPRGIGSPANALAIK